MRNDANGAARNPPVVMQSIKTNRKKLVR